MEAEQKLTGRKKKTTRERGQALIEFAMVIPILLILAFAIIDFGWAMRDYVTLTNAAREGARLGVVACKTAANETAIKQRAVDYSSDLLELADVTVNDGTALCSTVPVAGTALKVRVDYDYTFITPLWGIVEAFSFGALPDALTLSSTTTMRLE